MYDAESADGSRLDIHFRFDGVVRSASAAGVYEISCGGTASLTVLAIVGVVLITLFLRYTSAIH